MKKNQKQTTSSKSLIKTLSTAPVRFIAKQLTAAIKDKDVDTTSLEWHKAVAGIKVFGAGNVTFADTDKSTLVCYAESKSDTTTESKGTSLYALTAVVADKATALQDSEFAESAKVSAVVNAISELNKASLEAKRAAERRATIAAERAQKAQDAVIAYLRTRDDYATASDADLAAAAANIKLVKGKKNEKGLYCFAPAAVLSSLEFTYHAAFEAARAAAAAESQIADSTPASTTTTASTTASTTTTTASTTASTPESDIFAGVPEVAPAANNNGEKVA